MSLRELDTAFVIEDLKLPGFDFHTLKGNKKVFGPLNSMVIADSH